MTSRRSSSLVESLETRSLCSAVSLGAHALALPGALANLDSYGVGGVTLSNGRLLAIGIVQDENNNERNFYVRYNKDGTLDQTFGSGGIAIQSMQRMPYWGEATAVYRTADDTTLIQFPNGLRRLNSAGQFDMSYGGKGLVPFYAYSVTAQSDGTVLAVVDAGPSTMRLVRFDAQGDILRVGAKHQPGGLRLNSVQPFSNGLVAALDWHQTDTFQYLTLSNTNFDPVKTFGLNGTLNISTLPNWPFPKEKWYNNSGLMDYTSAQPWKITTARDGGYVVDYIVNGSLTMPTPAQIATAVQPTTILHLHLSATGKLISASGPDITGSDDRSATAFYPAIGQFAGTFHFDRGADVTYSLGDGLGTVISTVSGPNAFYMIGETGVSWTGFGARFGSSVPAASHFTVMMMNPPGGVISGVLFNDHDHDGTLDASETTSAGRTVYIDTNDNGRLDAGDVSTTTDASGHYTFSDLGPGQYYIRRVLPAGFHLTTPVVATDVTAGSKTTLNIGSTATA